MQSQLDKMSKHFAVVFACLGAPWAACAAPVPLSTNLPGAVTYAGPPPGFDVVHATDSELDQYGFPPRPPRTARGQDRLRWEQMAVHARVRVMPVLEQTSIAAGPPRRRSAVVANGATSINWSAEVIQINANGFGPGAFREATSTFNIPAARQAFGVCTGDTDRLFTWVGIDGWTLDQVFQAGTESDATCVGGVSSPFYSAWYEWYPYFAVRITNLAVSPGDVMGVIVYATGPTTGFAWISNETTFNYAIISFTAPPGITLKGDSAEWVQERPTWNGQRTTLTNYVTAWMSNASAALCCSTQAFTFAQPPPGASVFGVTMLDDAGGPISSVTALGGNNLVFSDRGSAY